MHTSDNNFFCSVTCWRIYKKKYKLDLEESFNLISKKKPLPNGSKNYYIREKDLLVAIEILERKIEIQSKKGNINLNFGDELREIFKKFN